MKFRYDEQIEQFLFNNNIERYFSNINTINILHIFYHESTHPIMGLRNNQTESDNQRSNQHSNNEQKT